MSSEGEKAEGDGKNEAWRKYSPAIRSGPGLKWLQGVGAKPAAAAESGEIPLKAAAFGLFKDQHSQKSSALISDSRLGGAS